MLLAFLVMWALPTHPFRDGAPFLLLIDTSNIWGDHYVFSICYIETFCLFYPMVYKTVCNE